MAACTVSFLLWIIALQQISAQDYSSQWAAHIEGGLKIAKITTEKHGFMLLGEVNNCTLLNLSISNANFILKYNITDLLINNN